MTAVLAFGLSGCMESPSQTPASAEPAVGTSSGDDLDLGLTFSDAAVIRVIDGDSMIAEIGGRETEIRLQGINAPERDECLGEASRQLLEDTLDTGRVQISEVGPDQFDRTLAVVAVSGLPVNVTQVAKGLALPLATQSPIDDLIMAAEQRAREDRIGIWDPTACGTGEIFEVSIVALEPNPPGRDEENLDGEYLVLRNESSDAIDLSGWTLRDESTANRYSFPVGFVLAPDTEVEVSVGCELRPGRLNWCAARPVWNNGGDTALLLNSEGGIVDVFRYRDAG